jgi:hypothetical protein
MEEDFADRAVRANGRQREASIARMERAPATRTLASNGRQNVVALLANRSTPRLTEPSHRNAPLVPRPGPRQADSRNVFAAIPSKNHIRGACQ